MGTMADVGMRTARTGVAIAAALVLLAGCGDVATRPGSTAAPLTVVARRDVEIDGVTTADVFAPAHGIDLPTVVLLHGTGGERTAMEPLAVEVARGGAVVYVPSWPVIDQVAPFPTDGHRAYQRQVDAVVCSVAFARRHAPVHGGDPGEVTLLGHSGGATVGARVAIADWTGSVTACDAGAFSVPERFVGTGGDYFGMYQYGLERAADYGPFDLFEITPDDLGVEFRLIHGFGDATVESLAATRFDAHLRTHGLDSAVVYTDSGHSDLIDPDTNAGRFVVEQVLALIHHERSAFDAPSTTTRLTMGTDTCGHDGTAPPLGEPTEFVLANLMGRSGWFAFVGLQIAPPLTLEDLVAEAGSNDTSGFPPEFVDFGGFVPVPAGSSTILTWVRLDGDQQWAVYAMADPDPLHPMGWPSCVLWNTEAMHPVVVF